MLDLQRYAFYDAKRTMRLTLEPVSILEMLQDLPGELLFSAPLPAARLGVPCASPDVMHARAAEFAQFDEETAFRLWFNPEPSADGRSVYVSAPDALPEMNGAPDFGIASAGFLIGSTLEMLQWVQSLTGAETPDEQRSELSKMLSAACEPPHAAILTELSSGTELALARAVRQSYSCTFSSRCTVAGSQVCRRRLRILLEAGSHPRPGMRMSKIEKTALRAQKSSEKSLDPPEPRCTPCSAPQSAEAKHVFHPIIDAT